MGQLIDDYSALRQLPAFQSLEDRLSSCLAIMGAP
jgi:hypothetical protein